jgi:hypothetical protein
VFTINALVALTDAFCRAHLDEEYAQLARQVTAALCRKRPSPLATGNLKTWWTYALCHHTVPDPGKAWQDSKTNHDISTETFVLLNRKSFDVLVKGA